MEKQTVLEVYKKITQRIEALGKYPEKKKVIDEIINELNWVRAELEATNEVNPN